MNEQETATKDQQPLALSRNRSFLYFLAVKYLAACNDSFIQSGFLAFVTYALVSTHEHSQSIVFMATGLFMLPVFLFSALAGEIADRYDKAALLKGLKIFEIVIAVTIACSYLAESETGMLIGMFMAGLEATFFTPIRLSIVPSLTAREQLVRANSAIESGSYLSKFAGTIAGIVAGATINSFFPLILLCLATLGFLAARRIAAQEPADRNTVVHKMFLASMIGNLKYIRHSRPVTLSLVGLAGAWCVTVTFMILLSQVANVVYADGFGREILSPLFLGAFCLGIGCGAATAARVYQKDAVNAFLPLSAVIEALLMLDFTLILIFRSPAAAPLESVNSFSDGLALLEDYLLTFSGAHTVLCIFLITFFAAMFIVPVTAYLQRRSPEEIRSRIMSANNITAAVFTVVSSLIGKLCTDVFGALHGLTAMLALTAFVCIAGAFVTAGILPIPILRAIVRRVLHAVYRVRVEGLGNFEAVQGKRVVIIANHTSFLDGLLLWTYLHDNLSYAVDTNIAGKWYFRALLAMAPKYYTMDPSKPMAIKSMIREVDAGNIPVIFPEGRISTTGTLMKIYAGTAMVADRARADILPVIIEGGQFSVFSHFGNSLRRRPRARIVIRIMPLTGFRIPEELTGKRRREAASDLMYDLLAAMKVRASSLPKQSLFSTFINAVNTVGRSKKLLEDHSRRKLSAGKVLSAAFALGRRFRRASDEEKTGLLLPNSSASAIAFLALEAAGRTPCMLNFSGGIRNLLSCCDAVPVKTVCTARKFIEAGFQDLEAALKEHGVKLLYLEDLASSLSLCDRLLAIYARIRPFSAYRRLCGRKPSASDPAAILFTSGSEGKPKAVALSHENIATNITQLQAILPFGVRDQVFNSMPMFHSFGLTAGTLLPLLSGMKVFMYPSPLHYKTVPLLVYDTNSTVLFGTDTFLRGYGEYAHPFDMYSVKFAVAGGEKLKDETVSLWHDKFGIRILEGYGATETSPVIAVNTFMHYRRGTVGRALPDINTRIEEVPGISRGGRLWVQGDNVMLGYMRDSAPGVLETPEDRWYDTGDIAEIDASGFIRILGRAKRFAKIAGEMISLTQVEETLASGWQEDQTAVVAVPDARKGEQLVLFTTRAGTTRNEIRELFKAQGISELALPKRILVIDSLPLNGTGKIDHLALGRKALEALENTGA